MFIPLFNLYWQFVAVWGLSKDLNRYSREHNIIAPQANESLALAGCIRNRLRNHPVCGHLGGNCGCDNPDHRGEGHVRHGRCEYSKPRCVRGGGGTQYEMLGLGYPPAAGGV